MTFCLFRSGFADDYEPEADATLDFFYHHHTHNRILRGDMSDALRLYANVFHEFFNKLNWF